MMGRELDIHPKETSVYFLPIETRVPLKFGSETLTSVTCARVRMCVEGAAGEAVGWGETPLSVQWVWPSSLPYGAREEALKTFSARLDKSTPISDILDMLAQTTDVSFEYRAGMIVVY